MRARADPQASFAARANRPRLAVASPLRLFLLAAALVAAAALGFAAPRLIAMIDPATTAPDRRLDPPPARFAFDDGPASYADLAPPPAPPEPPAPEPAPPLLTMLAAPPPVAVEQVRLVPPPGPFPAEPAPVVEEPPAPAPSPAQRATAPSDAEARRSPVAFALGGTDRGGGGVSLIGPRTAPIGHRIEAVLDHAVDSETPGLVTATVLQDPKGLLPPGAKLIGAYDGAVPFTGSRLAIRFSEVQTQNRALAIRAQAADEAGRAGVEGEVDRHLGALVGLSALNVGAAVAVDQVSGGGESASDILGREIVRESVRLGRDVLRKSIDVAPTIRIEAGRRITVVFLEAAQL